MATRAVIFGYFGTLTDPAAEEYREPLAHRTGELLGAHMAGPEVTEMIQGYTIARTLESTEAELMHTVFPHPTLSEMMHESVLAAYGRPLHI